MTMLSFFLDFKLTGVQLDLDLKMAFGSVPKWTMEDNGSPLALRLVLVVETVKTERRLAKRIAKYAVSPCMHVKESVSGFFESVDRVVALARTKLFENHITRI